MNDTAFKSSFVNETSYSGMPEEKVRDYAIVSVKVPEGVTVQSPGKTITGPSSVTLMVTMAGMNATPDTIPAESWNTMGGWSGWNK